MTIFASNKVKQGTTAELTADLTVKKGYLNKGAWAFGFIFGLIALIVIIVAQRKSWWWKNYRKFNFRYNA